MKIRIKIKINNMFFSFADLTIIILYFSKTAFKRIRNIIEIRQKKKFKHF